MPAEYSCLKGLVCLGLARVRVGDDAALMAVPVGDERYALLRLLTPSVSAETVPRCSDSIMLTMPQGPRPQASSPWQWFFRTRGPQDVRP